MSTLRQDNQFGMFIHWGVYALTAYHEQARARLNLDRYDYRCLMKEFNPVHYNPDEWVKLAADAGMRYICFTAKHHDGFCLWDTKETDFNIMNTPYGKDVLAMLAKACARHQMKLSIYYSVPDWDHPNAYNPKSSHQCPPYPDDKPDTVLYRDYVKKQIKELLTGYGSIYTLFWDIPPQIDDPSMNEYVRGLQPDILINDRGYDEGDFSTPERKVPSGKHFDKMTEACQSVGRRSWGYRWHEDYHSTRFLKSSIAKIMAMGGSYLLNVGPMPDGKIDEKSVAIIQNIGKWFCQAKEALTGTRSSGKITTELETDADMPFIARDDEQATYLIFYEGMNADGITLAGFNQKPVSATLLNNGQAIDFEIATMPPLWNKKRLVRNQPGLHLFNCPVEAFHHEPMIIKLNWSEA